jgi:SAM-dependent methyltransferase
VEDVPHDARAPRAACGADPTGEPMLERARSRVRGDEEDEHSGGEVGPAHRRILSFVGSDALLAEQKRYYRERASEYDDWWFRRGRYALDSGSAARWAAEVAELESALEAFAPAGDVVELACGTGLWTRHLVGHATALTAVDASAETLALNRARVGDSRVEYVLADLFDWEPSRRYDVCFFGFWLSHVPEDRFDAFWRLVRRSLVPGGRVFLVDSGSGDGAHTRAAGRDTELRRLSDGREFRIVKRYWEPRELEERLAGLGWSMHARRTTHGAFLYASGE